MRVILTKTEDDANAALADLQEDNSEDSYADVAKKYSIDDATKSTGGLRQGVVEGQSEPALDKEIFAATQGDLVGPFKGDAGYYVIEVQKITPATTTSLEDATDQIKQTLVAARQQEIAQTFQTNFQIKWTARTFCADGYRIDAAPTPSRCRAPARPRSPRARAARRRCRRRSRSLRAQRRSSVPPQRRRCRRVRRRRRLRFRPAASRLA